MSKERKGFGEKIRSCSLRSTVGPDGRRNLMGCLYGIVLEDYRMRQTIELDGFCIEIHTPGSLQIKIGREGKTSQAIHQLVNSCAPFPCLRHLAVPTMLPSSIVEPKKLTSGSKNDSECPVARRLYNRLETGGGKGA